MLTVKYYFISPEQAYSILLASYCPNCNTFDVPQVPKRQNSKLEIYYVHRI